MRKKEYRDHEKYSEWFRKIHNATGFDEKKIKQREKSPDSYDKQNPLFLITIFLIAFIPRIIYAFFISDPIVPGWYTDVFHHWQIAFLSKEVGFSHGFLRLWDFKGMEFFWGLLHPLILVILFYITGSISILVFVVAV